MNSRHLSNIFFRATDLFPSFVDKRIFVVGASGFIGGGFYDFFHFLKSEGVNLTIHGSSCRMLREESYLLPLDVLDIRTYPEELLDADYIINCAGSAGGGEYLVHSMGGILLRMMNRYAILLHFSSGAVSVGSETEYAIAKAQGEARLAGQENVQIVRPFAVVGPNMDWRSHFAVPTFLSRKMAGVPLEVAPNVTRSFVHIVDLCVQCLHVMVAGDGRPYDVGSDDSITMEKAARLISDDVRIVERDYPTTSAARTYSADISRVKSHFNLDIEWTSVQAIEETVNHFFNQHGGK